MDYEVVLTSPVATSFRATKAANSLDIDQGKKATHRLAIAGADLVSPYNVGLIVGASGSGKTTLARQIYGVDAFKEMLDPALPVIDQFPASFSYDECAEALAGMGLTAVVCWIRPAATLSNGQRARAEAALQMASAAAAGRPVVIDEWTSVVDRTVAKVMSHCIQKHARRTGRQVVLLSCHYDVVEWLNPDWILDCNAQRYTDRRGLCREFQRSERLTFDIRSVGRDTWRYFSKYYYLTERLPGGFITTYGVFHGGDQIGFQCFANYVPCRPGTVMQMHSNRTVIHPDYAGLGLGIKVISATAFDMHAKGFDVRAKFSSAPIYRSMAKDPNWRLDGIKRTMQEKPGGNMGRGSGFREQVKTYQFRFAPKGLDPRVAGVGVTRRPEPVATHP